MALEVVLECIQGVLQSCGVRRHAVIYELQSDVIWHRRSLLGIGIVRIKNVVQLLKQMSYMCQSHFALSNSDSTVSRSFTSYGSNIIDSGRFQTSKDKHGGMNRSGNGIDSIHPTSTANPNDFDSTPSGHRQTLKLDFEVSHKGLTTCRSAHIGQNRILAADRVANGDGTRRWNEQ